MPSNAPSITSDFRANYSVTGRERLHESVHGGVDISLPNGTPILAAADGVVFSYSKRTQTSTGVFVELEHSDGDDKLYTLYKHLSHFTVKRGMKVKRGQIIAYSGDTGIVAGGGTMTPHLHFQVDAPGLIRSDVGNAKNPHKYWLDGPGKVTCFDPNKTYPPGGLEFTYPVPCKWDK